MKRLLTSVPMAIGLSLLFTGIAFAQGDNDTPASGATQSISIAAKLAGIVAAAAVVERIIEMIWDFIENHILAGSRLLGNANSYLKWAQREVNTAKSALVAKDAPASQKASELEEAFQRAEKRLTDYLKSPVYVSMKKKISMPIAIVFGVIVAVTAKLQMFELLGFLEADAMGWTKSLDFLITGLVIGTGSAPVHSLIGILQNTKDTVDAARALYTGKAIAEVTDMVKKLETRKKTEDTGVTITVESQAVQTEVPTQETATPRNPLDMERAARRMLKL